jgi:hypothetical protein
MIRHVGGPDEAVQLSIIWPGAGDASVMRSNAILGQIGNGPAGPEEILLTFGYVAPPVLLGSPEEQQAAVAAIGAVSANILCKISLSRGRAHELIELLRQQIKFYDQLAEGAQE